MRTITLAEQVTGFGDREFRSHTVPRVVSREQVNCPIGVCKRQSVRLAADLFVTTDELDQERRTLGKTTPRCLRGSKRS